MRDFTLAGNLFVDMDKALQAAPFAAHFAVQGIVHAHIPTGLPSVVFFLFHKTVQRGLGANGPFDGIEECFLVALDLDYVVIV